jgi:hypothetical protein
MSKRNRNCIWHCGRETKNKSRICDHCWEAAEILRSNSDAGYKAWCEHKRAKEVATKKKPMSENQRAALDAARRAFLLKQLPTSELLH